MKFDIKNYKIVEDKKILNEGIGDILSALISLVTFLLGGLFGMSLTYSKVYGTEKGPLVAKSIEKVKTKLKESINNDRNLSIEQKREATKKINDAVEKFEKSSSDAAKDKSNFNRETVTKQASQDLASEIRLVTDNLPPQVQEQAETLLQPVVEAKPIPQAEAEKQVREVTKKALKSPNAKIKLIKKVLELLSNNQNERSKKIEDFKKEYATISKIPDFKSISESLFSADPLTKDNIKNIILTKLKIIQENYDSYLAGDVENIEENKDLAKQIYNSLQSEESQSTTASSIDSQQTPATAPQQDETIQYINAFKKLIEVYEKIGFTDADEIRNDADYKAFFKKVKQSNLPFFRPAIRINANGAKKINKNLPSDHPHTYQSGDVFGLSLKEIKNNSKFIPYGYIELFLSDGDVAVIPLEGSSQNVTVKDIEKLVSDIKKKINNPSTTLQTPAATKQTGSKYTFEDKQAVINSTARESLVQFSNLSDEQLVAKMKELGILHHEMFKKGPLRFIPVRENTCLVFPHKTTIVTTTSGVDQLFDLKGGDGDFYSVEKLPVFFAGSDVEMNEYLIDKGIATKTTPPAKTKEQKINEEISYRMKRLAGIIR